MIAAFLRRWAANRGRVRADAVYLVATYADNAYGVARNMARAERTGRLVSPTLPDGHWDRVRRQVKRMEGRL